MRGSKNLRRGAPGQSDKKRSDNVFLVFFLVLSLFYRSQMVNFKENYHFSRFWRGPNIFQGGLTYSRGGGGGGGFICIFPIETHITCDFPGGSGSPREAHGDLAGIDGSSRQLTPPPKKKKKKAALEIRRNICASYPRKGVN